MRHFPLLIVACLARAAFAADSAELVGEPVLEKPTLHCLGAYWIIKGDANKNAAIAVEYRKAGQPEWRKGMPLFRVEKGAQKGQKGTGMEVPADAWLFAGSVVNLDPDTAYELKLSLKDPDGGAAEKLLAARTIAEPAVAKDAPMYHVAPGAGGGTGTAADPFKGLAAAQAAAKPGDVFLLHVGTYEGTFEIKKSGESGKPIVWRGAGDGEAILDAQGKDAKRPGRGISVSGIHDVWFEKLTLRNADWGIVAHDSARIVVRRCHIHQVDYGFTSTRNTRGDVTGLFLCDNLIEGPCTWPRTKGIEDPRGIQITGEGNIVCYNRVRGFSDAIDTMPSRECAAIDFHNNDCSECTDDGMEMDYSFRNTRSFNNRFTNCFQGISLQPIFGGPVYVFRNSMYNVCMETFKMHNAPSGFLLFHNTCVKRDVPLTVQTPERVRNAIMRNNLFIGTESNYAIQFETKMIDCDFDYDGIGGGPWKMFLKWNKERYPTLQAVKDKAPVYHHLVLVDPATAFASGIKQPADEKTQFPNTTDLRPVAGSAAIDAGQVLPSFNDDFAGKAPDLGAYELGQPVPHYGPRPEGK